ncbi:hypothetical protein G9A89_021475 [Geosiphon pyriformis]|nr:hypothetical protein G9A89_021475 [Geosiphon pyriformis]
MEKLTLVENHKTIQELSWLLNRAKKIIIVTGAGVSTGSGIPDFRSKDGLHELIKRRFPNEKITGQQLFDRVSLNNHRTAKIFYTFMGELRNVITYAQPTKAHCFFKRLAENKTLLRYYTQNVDNLEAIIGLEAVQLHGNMAEVFCNICRYTTQFTNEHTDIFKSGEPPTCPECEIRETTRKAQGKRRHQVGALQPNITLYNDIEDYGRGTHVQKCIQADLKKKPDFLLVLGTSLKVYGLKNLIKKVAQAVHEKGGHAILVNVSDVGKEWNEVFDYHILAEADKWAEICERFVGLDKKQTTLLQTPTVTTLRPRKNCLKRTKHESDQEDQIESEHNYKKPKKLCDFGTNIIRQTTIQSKVIKLPIKNTKIWRKKVNPEHEDESAEPLGQDFDKPLKNLDTELRGKNLQKSLKPKLKKGKKVFREDENITNMPIGQKTR